MKKVHLLMTMHLNINEGDSRVVQGTKCSVSRQKRLSVRDSDNRLMLKKRKGEA